jgi:hypothetical protein
MFRSQILSSWIAALLVWAVAMAAVAVLTSPILN